MIRSAAVLPSFVYPNSTQNTNELDEQPLISQESVYTDGVFRVTNSYNTPARYISENSILFKFLHVENACKNLTRPVTFKLVKGAIMPLKSLLSIACCLTHYLFKTNLMCAGFSGTYHSNQKPCWKIKSLFGF